VSALAGALETSSEAAPAAAGPRPAGTPDATAGYPFADRPATWSFFQALRRLEALHPEAPRLGRTARPRQDVVRLGQEPTTTFAPSTLASFEAADGQRLARLSVFFFGLFGTDGPLPLHLTEYAHDRHRIHRDPTFQRFCDMFHHRLLSLFYRAWADARPTVSFDRPQADHFARYVASLIGLGFDTLRDRDAMPDLTKLHFAGHLACQTRHPDGLAAILAEFFRMPVRIECFIGAWLDLPPSDRTRLGHAPETASIGRTALVGARIWSRQHKFRIVFGPLTLVEYERLLPGGQSFRRLVPIVRNYAGDTLEWEVNLLLRRDEVPKTVLGRQGRMGWTTWLGTRRHADDAGDLFLNASADSMARRYDAESPASRAEPVI